tara:strand:- start:4844 stop:5662 length:819 start_codon:yes stop_codon:yes gene_type:complete
MGLLSVEERGRIQEALSAPESEEPSGVEDPVTSEEQPVEASAEATEEEGAVEASETEEASQVDEEESGHKVPYERFKTINSQRKSAIEERDSLRSQIEELQRQLSTKKSPEPKASDSAEESSDDGWLDELLGDDGVESPKDNRIQSIEERLANFELAQAQVDLKKEVGAARSDFPEVPEELLLQAVIQDPAVNIREVAEHYAAFVASIEEAALARHVKGTKSDQVEAASPPPRPPSVGSSGGNEMLGADDARPKTLKDASSAARQWLSKAGW